MKVVLSRYLPGYVSGPVKAGGVTVGVWHKEYNSGTYQAVLTPLEPLSYWSGRIQIVGCRTKNELRDAIQKTLSGWSLDLSATERTS